MELVKSSQLLGILGSLEMIVKMTISATSGAVSKDRRSPVRSKLISETGCEEEKVRSDLIRSLGCRMNQHVTDAYATVTSIKSR